MKQGLHQLILKVYELSVSQVDNNTVQLIHAKWMNLGKFCVALRGILFVLYVEPNRTETFIVTDRMNSSISFTLVFFFLLFSDSLFTSNYILLFLLYSDECDVWEAENGTYEKKEYMIKSNERTKGR